MAQNPDSADAGGLPEGALVVPPQPVRRLVGRKAVDVASGSSLRDTLAALVDNDVGALLITDDDDDVKGIVSERDLIDVVHDGADLDAEKIESVMQPDIITIAPEATVVDAARVMIDRGVRHLLVEGPDGGVVSIRAVLRSMVV